MTYAIPSIRCLKLRHPSDFTPAQSAPKLEPMWIGSVHSHSESRSCMAPTITSSARKVAFPHGGAATNELRQIASCSASIVRIANPAWHACASKSCSETGIGLHCSTDRSSLICIPFSNVTFWTSCSSVVSNAQSYQLSHYDSTSRV